MESTTVFAHLDDGRIIESSISNTLSVAFFNGESLFYCEEGSVFKVGRFRAAASAEMARKLFFWDLEKAYTDEIIDGTLCDGSEHDGDPFDPPRLTLPLDSIVVHRVVRLELVDSGGRRAA